MKLLERAPIAGAFALLLLSLAVYLAYAANLITFPFDYDQGEGFELVDTILFSQFQWPYQNTDSYPFYASNYPPLFHVMAVPFVWLFGPGYWYGRLLGFLGTLVTAGAVYYAVQRQGRVRWVAALSALALLASNTIYHIGPLLRQHMTMVMFETLAIILLAYAFPQRKRWQIALALLLLIAAGYTKQLAAISAVAAISWMLLRNPRRGLVWTIGFCVVGGLIFAWMTWATNGEWWRQAILANVNAFDPFQSADLFILWWQLHGFLVIPAVLLVIRECYRERISLYAVWFVFSLLLGGIGSGTWGAGDSYFATAITAMCILSGIFLSDLVRQLNAKPRPYWQHLALLSIPLLYIGYGVATFKLPTTVPLFEQLANLLAIEGNVQNDFFDSASYDVVGYANIGHFVTAEDAAAGWEIVRLIEASDGPVLSEEAGFSLAAGRDVITNPTQLRNLWLNGLWQGDELIAMIETQQFDLIILRAQFYPQPVLEAIGQHYAISKTIFMNGFEYSIWSPSSSPG